MATDVVVRACSYSYHNQLRHPFTRLLSTWSSSGPSDPGKPHYQLSSKAIEKPPENPVPGTFHSGMSGSQSAIIFVVQTTPALFL